MKTSALGGQSIKTFSFSISPFSECSGLIPFAFQQALGHFCSITLYSVLGHGISLFLDSSVHAKSLQSFSTL